MRRLSSGLRLYSNNRKLLSSAVSQSHVNTVQTSYSQHCHREKKKRPNKTKKETSTSSNTALPQQSQDAPLEKAGRTLYLQDDYLHYSQMIQDSSHQNTRKVFVLFLITAQHGDEKPKLKRMSTFIHPRRWQAFSRSSSMAVGRHRPSVSQSTARLHSQKQSGQKASNSGPLKVCLWHGIYGYIKYSIIIKGAVKCLYSFLHIYSVTAHDTTRPGRSETDPRTLLGAEKKRTSAARADAWIKK